MTIPAHTDREMLTAEEVHDMTGVPMVASSRVVYGSDLISGTGVS